MKVVIVTQAYNVKSYIEQCVKSVLSQTYSDFQYILIDNGSTDGSGEIMKKYAESDGRIKFIQYEKNGSGRWLDALNQLTEGEYFTVLDGDDWLEPNYLTDLVNLADSTGADIVTTGSEMCFEGLPQTSRRTIEKTLILDKDNYADAFCYFHVFFRAVWAKLIRVKIFKLVGILDLIKKGIGYGGDTLYSFAWLKNARRICIDKSMLHHYRIRPKSVSHNYDPRQSYSDIYLYNDAIDFLSPYGPISSQNQDFLYRVYSNAMLDTNANIKNSTLTPAEKMREYRVILERDVTKKAFAAGSEDAVQSRADLIGSVLSCASELPDDNEDLNAIKTEYFPECSAAVYANSAKLFLADSVLFDYLINGYRKPMVKYILSLIDKQKFVKQYDLCGILRRLSQDKPILADISDMKFLKKYGDIYLLVWNEKYSDSLDIMTDIMLKEAVGNETFLQLYLSLAAGLERVDEFVFGKIKLAAYYCLQKRADDCRAILTDLTEMGVEDNDELLNIRQQLKLI